MVELANFWLPIVGAGLFFAWGLAAYFGGNKILGIWVLFAAGVCLLALIALQWQQSIFDMGEPTPADKPSAADVIRDRAYVAPFDATVTNLGSPSPTVVVMARNTGRTPAQNLTWRVTFDIAPYPDVPDIILDQNIVAPKYSMPPDTVLSQQWTFQNLSADFVARLAAGTAAFVITGEINYSDVFGNRRFTKFKLVSANTPGHPRGKFANANSGNDAN